MNSQLSAWFTDPAHEFEDDEVDCLSVTPLSGRHSFDPDAMHEGFHESTKYHRRTHAGFSRQIRAYLTDPGLIAKGAAGRKEYDGSPGLALPDPEALNCGLAGVLAARRSTRRADLSDAIGAGALSTILHHSARVNRTGRPPNAPHVVQTFRPYPSGGGLFPVEIYPILFSVEGLPQVVSCYDAREHLLRPLCGLKPQAFRSAETVGEYLPPAACAIVVTAVFERSVQKYGSRGYRLALIEAGHLMQNILLVATGLGLCSLVSGSFYEAEAERSIGVDGVSEGALATVFLGGRA